MSKKNPPKCDANLQEERNLMKEMEALPREKKKKIILWAFGVYAFITIVMIIYYIIKI